MQLAAFKAAVLAPDTQPPTAPADLAASAISMSQINLAWTASTDNTGVTGYLIERCQGAGCSDFAQVGTATGTSFNNTGLAIATSYSYRVRATDAAGNLGASSNIADAHHAGRYPAAHRPVEPDGDRLGDADQPRLDRIHGQRRRHRLFDRAVPGRRLLRLRVDRGGQRDDVHEQRTRGERPTTATGCARRTPPATSAASRTRPAPPRRLQTRRAVDPVQLDGAGRLRSPGQPRLDGVDGQRRRHRLHRRALRGGRLSQLGPDRNADWNDVQRRRRRRRNHLSVLGAGHGRRRQPQQLVGHRHGGDPRARHPTAHGAADPDGHGAVEQPDQPRVDARHRQRRDHQLLRRTLPGRRLHQLRASCLRERPPPSATPGSPPRRRTATGCVRPTRPATSAVFFHRVGDDVLPAGDARLRARAATPSRRPWRPRSP